MALEISEFAGRMRDALGGILVFQRPPLAVQPPITIGTAARSDPFSADTRFARLRVSAGCRIKVYDPPEGADTTTVLPDGSDGGEYFPAGEHVIGVRPGQKLAVVAASDEGGSDPAPENLSKPVITGDPVVGQSLGYTPGTWENGSPSSVQWRVAGVPSGTGATYDIQAEDAGKDIVLREFAIGDGGAAYIDSDPITVEALPELGDLTLSASSIPEGSAAGTVVGAISGTAEGSTLSMQDDAGGRFAISGGNLVAGDTATDYETATSHSITIRETLGEATHDTALTITVTNVYEQPSLGALSLSSTTFTIGTPASGSIDGATSGSTISASGLPSGLTIDGAARTWTWSGEGAAESSSITLTETLADSDNSPRDSVIAVEIVEETGAPASYEEYLDAAYADPTSFAAFDFTNGQSRKLSAAGVFDHTEIMGAGVGLSMTNRNASVEAEDALGNIITATATQPLIIPGTGFVNWGRTINLFMDSQNPATQYITLPSTASGATTLLYLLVVIGDGYVEVTPEADTGSPAVITGAAVPNNVAAEGFNLYFGCSTVGKVKITVHGEPHGVYLLKGNQAAAGYTPIWGAAGKMRVVSPPGAQGDRYDGWMLYKLDDIPGYDPHDAGITVGMRFWVGNIGWTSRRVAMFGTGDPFTPSPMGIAYNGTTDSKFNVGVYNGTSFLFDVDNGGGIQQGTGNSHEVTMAMSAGPSGIRLAHVIRNSNGAEFIGDAAVQYNSTALASLTSSMPYLLLGRGRASNSTLNTQQGNPELWGVIRSFFILAGETTSADTLNDMAWQPPALAEVPETLFGYNVF